MSEEIMLVREEARLHAVVEWRLRHNHYPPISRRWVPIVVKLIEAWNRGEEPESVLDPNGDFVPVGALVEGLHLNDFRVMALGEPEEEETHDRNYSA